MKYRAVKYYCDGVDCARSILFAAADKHSEITKEVINSTGAISNGFGVGTICSCIVAGIMVLSAVLGEEEAKNKRLMLMSDFSERFYSLNCAKVNSSRNDCKDVIGFVCDWLEEAGI